MKVSLIKKTHGSLGLKVHEPEKWMKMGDSIDFGFCDYIKSGNSNCGLYVDMYAYSIFIV
jgi:hypothetical protein